MGTHVNSPYLPQDRTTPVEHGQRLALFHTVLNRALKRPLPSVLGVLVAIAAGWFALGAVFPSMSPLPAWALTVLSAALTALACVRVARAASLPAPVRSFWQALGWAAGVLAVGAAGDAHGALSAHGTLGASGAPSQQPGPVALVMYLGAVLIALWALLRLPVGRRSRTEWLALGLDAGIIMLSAGLFAWYFVIHGSPELAALTGSSLPGLAIITLAFGAVLAAVKLALTSAGLLDRHALSLLGLGVLGGATGGALMPLLHSTPHLYSTQVTVPLASFLLALAAERQRQAAELPAPPPRRRPFNLLPYGAITATGALLLVSAWEPNGETLVIAAGTLVLTVLVAVRQVMAFRDNAALLARLDASMLELRRHEQRFRSLVQNSSDMIAITGGDMTLVYVSPSSERVLGVPAEEGVGRPVTGRVHPDDLPVADALAAELMAAPGATAACQVRMLHADGTWRWLEVIATNRMDDPSVRGIVSNTRDITETRRYQERLTHQASHDALTGLANRTLFAERTAQALADGGDAVALALIDLDDFKSVNDRLGHAVGDALLTATAERLRACVRPGDTVARLGGDEFALLLTGISADEADGLAGRVVAALGTPVDAAGHHLLVRASVGLVGGRGGAPADGPVADASELLRRADLAMYAAKEQGKSRYARYTEAMDTCAVEHARLGAELRRALAAGELFLLYQPVVALPDGELRGVEALVRWRHPERGMVSPAQFIPVAERNGMIVEIGAWVLREACRQMADWRRRYGAAPLSRMAVNVSARQLREPEFAQAVADVLEETGLAPEDLLLEITETAVFDGGLALETVRAVRELGVGVALDDFGTGHSSLGLLRTCPVDALKVDKLFVDGVTGTAEQSAIAASLAQIARALRLRIVAEGVETSAQARRLYQLGYRLAQGFHFARPLPAERIDGMLAARAGHGPEALEPPALAS
ncbi:putative bifunctional diguanylate cyclase/phosphodiesterase [Planomonospora corallina]|uniref:Bifunctional diguanylate cyclase/phosphodiesterase n=1 Tax=Planomonospora corallina TaxID=1806052 RepID=A0ABV8IK52_9ACTN